ncbi:hypothetical protein Pcaca04_03120 [Pectobacterium carotovorum subsp. carotovorum]|nr:hypothetical protein Pcaca04_03120 [Pectobacterium carotovorum subsp. carotovorum]
MAARALFINMLLPTWKLKRVIAWLGDVNRGEFTVMPSETLVLKHNLLLIAVFFYHMVRMA